MKTSIIIHNHIHLYIMNQILNYIFIMFFFSLEQIIINVRRIVEQWGMVIIKWGLFKDQVDGFLIILHSIQFSVSTVSMSKTVFIKQFSLALVRSLNIKQFYFK